MKRMGGFTLVEILVSMAVLAFGLMAAMTAVGQLTANEVYLRDRTQATWVAHNLLLEAQLKGDWPGVGNNKGDVDFASRNWLWRVSISQTPEQDMRRLDVEVWLPGEEKSPLVKLAGFVEKP